MKKKKLDFLLVLLAALVLVLAGACSSDVDDSIEAGVEQGSDGGAVDAGGAGDEGSSGDEAGGDDGEAATTIDSDYIKTFLGGIQATIDAADSACWTFEGGEWDASGSPAYTLAGGGTKSSSQLDADAAIAAVKGLGVVASSDGLVQIDFSEAAWEEEPAGADDGKIAVKVTLNGDADSSEYAIDESDESLASFGGEGLSVTLVLKATDVTSYSGGWSIYINFSYLNTFLGSITDPIGGDGSTYYWTFVGGSVSADANLTYVLKGTGSSSTVSAAGVIAGLKALGEDGIVTSEDGLLKIDFSDVAWDTVPSGSASLAYITVKAEIAADDISYTIDSNFLDKTSFEDNGFELTLAFIRVAVTSTTGTWTD